MSEEIGQNRLLSLDVFRGMTIAGMVLVNNPGTWSQIFDGETFRVNQSRPGRGRQSNLAAKMDFRFGLRAARFAD